MGRRRGAYSVTLRVTPAGAAWTPWRLVFARRAEPTRPRSIGYPRLDDMLKIDVFPHILPRPFYDRLMEVAPRGGLMVKRVQHIPVMIDLDKRFEVMDR